MTDCQDRRETVFSMRGSSVGRMQDEQGRMSGGKNLKEAAGWKLIICRAGGWKFGGTKVRHSRDGHGLGR